MNKHTESKPTKVTQNNIEPIGPVPFSASPAGDPRSICDWANGSVWTKRMLTTLATGVRGGKWHALIDTVYRAENLFTAYRKVTGKDGAGGVDHVSCEVAVHGRRPGMGTMECTAWFCICQDIPDFLTSHFLTLSIIALVAPMPVSCSI